MEQPVPAFAVLAVLGASGGALRGENNLRHAFEARQVRRDVGCGG